MSKEIKDIDRQIKEALVAANSPYLSLDKKIEAFKEAKVLKEKRLLTRKNEIIKDFIS